MGIFDPMAIMRQQIELESCSNSLKMGKVLQFRIKTKFKLGCRFFVDVDMMGVCLCIFYLHSNDVIRPWTTTRRAIF